MSEGRKLSPENVRYLWDAIRNQKHDPANAAKVFKYLTTQSEYKPEEAEDVLLKAVDDGFLISISPAATNSNGKNSGKLYKIPDIEDIQVDNASHDWYCYECHKPENLQSCDNCLRSFHFTCKRENPEKPNDVIKVTPNFRHIRPILKDQISDTLQLERDPEISETSEPPNDPVNETPDESEEKPSIEESLESLEQSIREELADLKDDSKDNVETKDVICIGQIRPPSRRRRANSVLYKAENTESEAEEDDNLNLCTRCRLLKISSIRDPPNMKPEELNHLLKFTFDTIKTWINFDTFSPLPFSKAIGITSKKDFDLFSKLCFKYPNSLENIDQKLKANKYESPTEFQCDMLDVQHCIGVLYGNWSTEYEATKYLLTDCAYELSEIRQCRDCYRHSNEKVNVLWFCKPCVPRHELVFAKQIGYSYWPAKVIKVKDNQYDVRFFGAQHSRAIVDGSSVKPIDTDVKSLKIKTTVGFTKAMEELRRHQELLQLPPGQFSYEAERVNPINFMINAPLLHGHMSNLVPMAGATAPIVEKKIGAAKRKSYAYTPLSINFSPKGGVIKKLIRSGHNSIENKATKNDVVASNNIQLGVGKRRRYVQNYAAFENSGTGDTTTPSDHSPAKRKSIENKIQKTKRRSQKKSSSRIRHSTPSTKSPTSDDLGNSQDSFVSSTQESTPHSKKRRISFEASSLQSNTPTHEVVESLRNQLENARDLAEMQKIALDTLQAKEEQFQEKLHELEAEHAKTISKIKKRQWCYYCEKEAIYYCCWNTAYCSTDCQQMHWQAEHKRSCRRIR